MFLFDVNLLIALADAGHVHHSAALRFHHEQGVVDGWATCPVTENGFLRIFGHANYAGGLGSPADARRVLISITDSPGHQFWPDDVSLKDSKAYPALPVSKHVTDFYLLSLAVGRGARLATFDRRIDLALLPGAGSAYFVVPS